MIPYICHVIQRQNSTAAFTGWTAQEWHQDTFLAGASVSEKEVWLDALVRSRDKSIDIEALLFVINALCESRDVAAARRAEQWIRRWEEDCPSVEPTTAVYEAVIRTWANMDKETPAVVVNRAERWLNELLARHEEHPESESLRPTIELYNAFLDACTRGRSGTNKRNKWTIHKHAKRADTLLRKLHSNNYHQLGATRLAPNTDSFNFVLRGWSRCPEDDGAISRIMGLLRLMEAYQRDNPKGSSIRPNTQSYCLVMDSLIRVARTKARYCVENGDGYESKSHLNGIVEMNEAEAILKYMHDLHKAGIEGVVPHRVPYNIILTGWAGLAQWQHCNAAFRAEEILRRMLAHRENDFAEASPDRISYEKVMMAWANSRRPNAGQRAQFWLKNLWNESELEGDKNLLPKVGTYNIALRALAFSDGASAAESLLLDLGDKYREEADTSLCPNSESFAIVIRAWLREVQQSHHIDDKFQALNRAVEWLNSLREIENENNLSTTPEQYANILKEAKACARDRPQVLSVAEAVFNAQRQSRHGLDVFSYANLLSVGLEAYSTSDEADKKAEFVLNLFNKCRDDGLVGKHFIQALAGHTNWNIDAREELMKATFYTFPFPLSWTRNIRSHSFMARESDFRRSGGFHGPPIEQQDDGEDCDWNADEFHDGSKWTTTGKDKIE